MSDKTAHKNLCDKAIAWLKRFGCGVVISEMSSSAGEEPDAIGWKYGISVLIECKTSRSDFIADSKKLWRQYPEYGLGAWRFYLAPIGLIKVDELPKGWGLIEINGRRTVETYGVPPNTGMGNSPFEQTIHSIRKENLLLLSALRRLQKGKTHFSGAPNDG